MCIFCACMGGKQANTRDKYSTGFLLPGFLELHSFPCREASFGHFSFSTHFHWPWRSCWRCRVGNKVNIIFAFVIVQLSCCRQLMLWRINRHEWLLNFSCFLSFMQRKDTPGLRKKHLLRFISLLCVTPVTRVSTNREGNFSQYNEQLGLWLFKLIMLLKGPHVFDA